MATAAHFHLCLGNRYWIAVTPVAGGIHPNALASICFNDVNGALWCALGVWVERHATPEALIKHVFGGVLFDVVNQHPSRIKFGKATNCVQNQQGALEFVF